MSRTAAAWALVLALAAFLHLRGLGETALWQDEAETAVLARRVLRYGLPKADDGTNLVSQNQGLDHDRRGLWSYSPWLMMYASAVPIAVLGPTAWAARLPSALCALALLPLLFALSKRWSGSERIAWTAVGLTLASVPWLLHARQCRWYAAAALLSLYLWWAYEEFLDGRPRARLHLVAAAFLLFHATFLVLFAVAGGVALHFLVCEARRRRPARADLRAAAAAFLALAPGFAYFRVFARAGGAGGVPVSRLENLRELVGGLDSQVFPLLLAAVAVWAALRTPRMRRPLALLGGGLAVLVLAPHFFFRYLVVFIPLASHLAAETLGVLCPRPVAAGLALSALLFSNAWSAGTWLGLLPVAKRDLLDMAAELRRPPKDAVRAAAELMGREAAPGELALVSYPDLSFMYHTARRVVGGGQGRRAVREEDVRWIVVRSEAERVALRVDWSRFERIELDSPDGPWGNRPDPGIHVFRDRPDAPRAAVYRRRA
ncbi:MAG: hypothetical protein HY928_14940 [Elusimicrobia bacterium]|nr:hypothetical protein [Elusimicrobiota bacterium]